MPELPDVEAMRLDFNAMALHRPIGRIEILSPELLRDVTPSTLQKHLCGNRFCATSRHGKHLFAQLEQDSWLTMHFGMTGGLAYCQDSARLPRFTRFVVGFTDGWQFAYVSQRKLGHIGLTPDPREFIRDHQLGPDALDPQLTVRTLTYLVGRRRAAIKTVLMDQHVIAGIGNLYADEILFQAGIAPTTPAHTLDETAIGQLKRVMQRVLQIAIAKRADPRRFPRTWLWHARRPDGCCPRCRTPLRSLKLGGRTTFWCPTCQTRSRHRVHHAHRPIQ